MLWGSYSCGISTDFEVGENGRMIASVELLTFGVLHVSAVWPMSSSCCHAFHRSPNEREERGLSVIRLGLRNIMITTSYKILSIGAFACVIPCQSVEKRWVSGGLFRVMTTTRFFHLLSRQQGFSESRCQKEFCLRCVVSFTWLSAT